MYKLRENYFERYCTICAECWIVLTTLNQGDDVRGAHKTNGEAKNMHHILFGKYQEKN